MANCNESENKELFLNWDIENFNFCWHKTGERLESPVFTVNASCKTSWRLWLYPRGEDDGEYISCYLFREKGGPEVVDVDFELFLFVEDALVTAMVSFSKIYSFKCYHREGLKCFVSRQEVFAPIASQKNRFMLSVGFGILNVDKKPINHMDSLIRTVIATYSISDIKVFDCDSNLELESTKIIEVKPILEDEPLLNLNLSYFGKYLVIKINPINCGKIKYAICKISIIKHWLDKSPIQQYVCSWIGEIKTKIWKCSVPQTEKVIPDVESSIHGSFLLHYDFSFSTGSSVTDTKRLNFSVQECLDASSKDTKSVRTVLSALEDVYRSHSFADLKVLTNSGIIPAHKAFVSARSPKMRALIPKDFPTLPFRVVDEKISEKFFSFIYSDTLQDAPWCDVLYLFKLGAAFEIKLLKAKCASYLKDRLSPYTSIAILSLAEKSFDADFKNFVTKYVINHAEDIFHTNEWKAFSKEKREHSMIMLLKYKKPNQVF